MKGLPDTFWSKVDLFGPIPDHAPELGHCWVWTRCVTSREYGCFAIGGKRYLTHRLSYADANGEIPPGLTIDHLCMNTRCVNPDHLEAVTMAENTRRARRFYGLERVVGGECREGHRLVGDNVKIHTKTGQVSCRICALAYDANYKAAAKDAVA